MPGRKMDRRSPLPERQGSTMDWKSHQTPSPNYRPTSSIYIDDVSIMTYLICFMEMRQPYLAMRAFLEEDYRLLHISVKKVEEMVRDAWLLSQALQDDF